MKKSILSIVTIASLVFTSCSLSDDDNTTVIDGEVTAQNLAGNLTSDLTLNSGIAHNLTGALLVKDGATLTIEAGTTINALAGGTDVYILVEKGGKIIAIDVGIFIDESVDFADKNMFSNMKNLKPTMNRVLRIMMKNQHQKHCLPT